MLATPLTDETWRGRVRRGIRLLDAERPGWPWATRPDGKPLFDITLLDMTRADLCAAGQVLGDFWNVPALAHLKEICSDGATPPEGVDEDEWDDMQTAARLEVDDIAIPLGFAAYPEDVEPLRRAWVAEVEELRAAGRPGEMAGAA